MALLEVKNLHVDIDGREILKGLDLAVNAGEVHAIMGPNGSGKSTLAYVLAGKEEYRPTAGGGRPWGFFSGFSISAGDPRRRHRPVPAPRAQCATQEARRRRAEGARIP